VCVRVCVWERERKREREREREGEWVSEWVRERGRGREGARGSLLSQVKCERVMSVMNESCHTWMHHVTHEWVMSHIGRGTHTHTHEREKERKREREREREEKNERESKRASKRADPPWDPSVIRMWHDSFLCVTWLNHVWHYSFSANEGSSVGHYWGHVMCEWVMSQMNESCHIWMSHVTHKNESCHIRMSLRGCQSIESCQLWMGHVTSGRFMSHMNGSCHVWTSRVTCGWVMLHRNVPQRMPINWVLSSVKETRHT